MAALDHLKPWVSSFLSFLHVFSAWLEVVSSARKGSLALLLVLEEGPLAFPSFGEAPGDPAESSLSPALSRGLERKAPLV